MPGAAGGAALGHWGRSGAALAVLGALLGRWGQYWEPRGQYWERRAALLGRWGARSEVVGALGLEVQ